MNYKHGLAHTRLDHIYKNMIARCYNKKSINYNRYGAKGITVCEEWNNDFMSFYKWAIDNGYRDDLTIDRIDVNGNYEPTNCRWVTKKEQSYNKRMTGKVDYYGIFLHSNGSCYVGQVSKNHKCVFTCTDVSKNKCAEKRNKYIIDNNLPNKLNVILPEKENIIKHKNKKEIL